MLETGLNPPFGGQKQSFKKRKRGSIRKAVSVALSTASAATDRRIFYKGKIAVEGNYEKQIDNFKIAIIMSI